MTASQETIGALVIRLLGPLEVQCHGAPLPRLYSRAGQWLLALLVLRHDRDTERAWLAGTLWPESEERQALYNLRRNLTDLRHALGREAGRLLSPTPRTLRLDLFHADCDLLTFDAAIQRGDEASLHEAVSLYRGPLLEGCTEEWVLPEREAREQAYLQALETLAGQTREVGEAARLLRRVIAVDRLRESAQRGLMQALAADGDYAAAVQVYRDLRLLLHRELSAEPDPQTIALFQKIRQEAQIRAQTPTSERPTPNTQPPIPRLPVQFTRFFGREEEIARLQALLAPSPPLTPAPRLLTLTGPGGSGKTRLAIETAESLKEVLDGAIWFVPLAALSDAALIPGAIVDALGLPRTPNLEPMEQVVTYLTGLSIPSLLILDNCEHLVEGGGPVVKILLERVPLLTVLATSRQPLNLEGEREFPVLPLLVPEDVQTPHSTPPEHLHTIPSVALFVDRAQARRPGFQLSERNAEAVSELCRRLEGIPLAIELAAGWARTQTPQQMLSRLEHRFAFLVSPRTDVSPRHLSLHAAMEWSYRLLSPELQHFFCRLSVFRGGWTAEAAEAVCEEPKAPECLARLVERSLVVAEEQGEAMRYQMLETLREFGWEELNEQERTAIQRSHRDYFRALAEEAAPHLKTRTQGEWLERLERDVDNLRGALAWCFYGQGEADECADSALRLCGALFEFWMFRGYLEEGRRRCEQALDMGKSSRPELRAAALLSLGYIAMWQDDYATEKRAATESLALGRQTNDDEVVAASLCHLSNVALSEGETSIAQSLATEAGLAARQAGSPWLLGQTLQIFGIAAIEAGDLECALSSLEESLALLRSCGDDVAASYSLANLGYIDAMQGRFSEAEAKARENLRLLRSGMDRRGTAGCFRGLGLIAADRKHWTRYATLLGAAEALEESMGRTVVLETNEVRASDARAALGEGAFAAAWAEGRAMMLEQAIAYALKEASQA